VHQSRAGVGTGTQARSPEAGLDVGQRVARLATGAVRQGDCPVSAEPSQRDHSNASIWLPAGGNVILEGIGETNDLALHEVVGIGAALVDRVRGNKSGSDLK